MKIKIILITFLLLIFTDSYPQIVNILDSLKNRMNNSTGKEKIEIMVAYGRMTAETSINESYNILTKAIIESKNNGYYDCLVKAYAYLINIYIPRGHPDSAYFYINESINISNQYRLYDLLGHSYTILGEYYLETDEYKKSYQAFLTSDSILSNNPVSEYICRNYIQFSRLLYLLEEYESAISYLKKGIEIAETNNFINIKADLYNKLALLSIKTKDYNIAEDYLNRAVKISEQNNYFPGLFENFQIYGDYNTDYTKNYLNAKLYYTKAYDIAISMGLKSFAATSATKISHILMLEYNFVEALLYAEKALKLREELGLEVLIGSSLINIGNVFLFKLDYNKAEEYISLGLQKVTRINLKANGYKTLYKARINLNDYKGALEASELYSAYRDSISKRESFKSVSQIELKYELEKSMHDISEMEYDLQRRKFKYSVFFTIGLLVALIFTTVAYLLKRKIGLQLQKINADSEIIIKERTKELRNEIFIREKTEEDLKAALEKEKYLNELKSKFVSMVSHEFRTPLAGIETSTDLLKMKLNKEHSSIKNDKYIGRIYKELKRFSALLDDILLFGRADTEKIKFLPQETDLIMLIHNLIDYLKRNNKNFVQPENISIKGIERNITIDRNMMETIFTNLFVNANKYSPVNTKWNIEVNFKDEYVDIYISDNGIGIPEDEISFLFESFFRGSNTTGIPGTGIGLITVKQMLDAHSGKISVENNKDKGVTFILKIPIVK